MESLKPSGQDLIDVGLQQFSKDPHGREKNGFPNNYTVLYAEYLLY
jgi:hypothetical protein